MSKDKPTKTEDEYFAKEDAEKAKRLREKVSQEDALKERERIKGICYMKCPKCGGNLNEVIFRGISIDRCSLCSGVWLDSGELEKLAGEEDKSVIGDIISLFGGKK